MICSKLFLVVDGRLEAGDWANKPNPKWLVCIEVGNGGGGSRPACLVDKVSKNDFIEIDVCEKLKTPECQDQNSMIDLPTPLYSRADEDASRSSLSTDTG